MHTILIATFQENQVTACPIHQLSIFIYFVIYASYFDIVLGTISRHETARKLDQISIIFTFNISKSFQYTSS